MNAYINNWVLSGFGFCKVILDIELHIYNLRRIFRKDVGVRTFSIQNIQRFLNMKHNKYKTKVGIFSPLLSIQFFLLFLQPSSNFALHFLPTYHSQQQIVMWNHTNSLRQQWDGVWKVMLLALTYAYMRKLSTDERLMCWCVGSH